MRKCILSLFLVAFIPPACTRAPDIERQIHQWVSAHNQHNVTKELSFYADDAVLVWMAGWKPAIGKAVLRDVFECDSVLNCELVFNDFVVRGDTLIANSVVERNDFFHLAGLPEVHYAPGTRLIFRNGLIEKMEVSGLIDEDQKSFNDFFSGLMAWMRVKHTDQVQGFLESTNFPNHNVRSAQMWVKLLTEYQVSKSSEQK